VYDKAGNVVAGSDEDENTSRFEYDDLQHKIREMVDYGLFSKSIADTYVANGLQPVRPAGLVKMAHGEMIGFDFCPLGLCEFADIHGFPAARMKPASGRGIDWTGRLPL
jgi:YD repeat-containing protein